MHRLPTYYSLVYHQTFLNHFNIKKPLFSYHQHNEQGKSDEILSKLEAGKNIAVVTDAGTPGISDPGSVVVRKCIENNIPFEVQ